MPMQKRNSVKRRRSFQTVDVFLKLTDVILHEFVIFEQFFRPFFVQTIIPSGAVPFHFVIGRLFRHGGERLFDIFSSYYLP